MNPSRAFSQLLTDDRSACQLTILADERVDYGVRGRAWLFCVVDEWNKVYAEEVVRFKFRSPSAERLLDAKIDRNLITWKAWQRSRKLPRYAVFRTRNIHVVCTDPSNKNIWFCENGGRDRFFVLCAIILHRVTHAWGKPYLVCHFCKIKIFDLRDLWKLHVQMDS